MLELLYLHHPCKQCAHQGLPKLINLISKQDFQFVALPESNLDPHVKSSFQTHSPCCPSSPGPVNTRGPSDFCHLVAIEFWMLHTSNSCWMPIFY